MAVLGGIRAALWQIIDILEENDGEEEADA